MINQSTGDRAPSLSRIVRSTPAGQGVAARPQAQKTVPVSGSTGGRKVAFSRKGKA
jgi:hypothetical protein